MTTDTKPLAERLRLSIEIAKTMGTHGAYRSLLHKLTEATKP